LALREHSAGFVVFRRRNDALEVLLIRSSEHSYWGFPKGIVDEGETDEEAARRELMEETGLFNIRVVPNFKTTDRYFYQREGKRIFKTVTFYAAELLSGEVKLSYEHSDYMWVSPEEAFRLIKFGSLREVLRQALGAVGYKLNEEGGGDGDRGGAAKGGGRSRRR